MVTFGISLKENEQEFLGCSKLTFLRATEHQEILMYSSFSELNVPKRRFIIQFLLIHL